MMTLKPLPINCRLPVAKTVRETGWSNSAGRGEVWPSAENGL